MDQHSENPPLYLTGLPPIINHDCRVLIVGSFPSSISLIRGEYYANPRNDFWKIMEVIIHMAPGLEYHERISYLLSHSIGLWDVVNRCTRPGSADSSIKDPQPSPIGGLLIRYPEIHTILCNGRRAEAGLSATLENYSGSGSVPRVQIRYLPSSSPAHAVMFHEKCKSWMILC
ncbi:MAG: DNA-deoxyinosine glycosylase, partial [Methanobacteriota archaeon]